MSKLKVLDLFSGIGGFSLGLERTGGFETVAFCEIDEACQKVLKHHWPDVPIHTDVRKVSDDFLQFTANKLPIDVICGGFPCQDISTANTNGKGLEGERSGLWFEYKRLIKEIKPRYAIIENVANLRSRGLNQVLKDLWEIGYDAEWHIISACSIGTPHRRERIWIIAYPNSSKLWEQSGRRSRKSRESETQSRINGEEQSTTNSDHVRLWSSFTSEEERRKWRTEATARFSNVFRQIQEVEPTVCGGDDGFPARLDKGRRQRIKQLGNAVVPQIPQLIGEAILKWEENNND